MIYRKETYKQLIRKSYGFDQEKQNMSLAWKIMDSLYQKNYLQAIDTTEKIPKKIHQIWLGDKQMPEIYLKYMESWKKFHPTWEYKLWTDEDTKSIEILKRETFDNAQNQGMRSDILRYEILRQFGGMYVDTDFECLRAFDDLLYLDFITGIGYDSKLQLYIGLLASVPNHCIMNKSINLSAPFYTGQKGSRIMNVTGVNHFTKCFLSCVTKETKGVVAFPMDFFYPFPNNMRRQANPYKYINACSYAIHHWGISWSKKGLK